MHTPIFFLFFIFFFQSCLSTRLRNIYCRYLFGNVYLRLATRIKYADYDAQVQCTTVRHHSCLQRNKQRANKGSKEYFNSGENMSKHEANRYTIGLVLYSKFEKPDLRGKTIVSPTRG